MAGNEVTIEVTMKPDGTMQVGRPLGFRPYVLVEVSEDDGRLVFDVQSGGGVPQEQQDLADMLGVIAEGLGYVPEPPQPQRFDSIDDLRGLAERDQG